MKNIGMFMLNIEGPSPSEKFILSIENWVIEAFIGLLIKTQERCLETQNKNRYCK